jgi:hypothetical protein
MEYKYELMLTPHRLAKILREILSVFLRNAGIYRRVYTAPEPRRTISSSSPPWKPQISQFLPFYPAKHYSNNINESLLPDLSIVQYNIGEIWVAWQTLKRASGKRCCSYWTPLHVPAASGWPWFHPIILRSNSLMIFWEMSGTPRVSGWPSTLTMNKCRTPHSITWRRILCAPSTVNQRFI